MAVISRHSPSAPREDNKSGDQCMGAGLAVRSWTATCPPPPGFSSKYSPGSQERHGLLALHTQEDTCQPSHQPSLLAQDHLGGRENELSSKAHTDGPTASRTEAGQLWALPPSHSALPSQPRWACKIPGHVDTWRETWRKGAQTPGHA